MELRFDNPRPPPRVPGDLTPFYQDQLRKALGWYDGEDLPIEVRLNPEPGKDWEPSFSGKAYLWDIVNSDEVSVYEAWFYGGDSGTVFHAGTLEVVLQVIQGGLEVSGVDREVAGLRQAVQEAATEARLANREEAKTITISVPRS